MSRKLEIVIPEADPLPHCSIYKIPGWMKELHKDAYKPQIVSLGPYHYGDPDLRPMEVYKEKILHRFLKNTGKSEEECIEMLSGIAQDLMDAYDYLEPRWKENRTEFLKLMLRDGLFVLRVLRYPLEDRTQSENDHIFNNRGSVYMPYIMRDMLMLENQLPLKLILTDFLLHEDGEHRAVYNRLHAPNIKQMLNVFFNYASVGGNMIGNGIHVNVYQLDHQSCHHLLHVYRQLLLKNTFGIKSHMHRLKHFIGFSGDILPIPASKLREAGITIKKSSRGGISEGIKFSTGYLGLTGVLFVPQLRIDHDSVIAFLNIVALEKLHLEMGNEVSSYLAFMEDIIKTEKDVEILEHVIFNRYGNEEAVARWFNGLPLHIRFNASHPQYLTAATGINRFYNRWLIIWRRHIVHDYFSDPWTLILRFGGSLFFLLTVIQTIFTVGQYYQGRHKK